MMETTFKTVAQRSDEMRTEERFVGSAEICRDEDVIYTSALYRVTLFDDGSVRGQVRVPDAPRLSLLRARTAEDWLQFKLDDHRVVFFQLRSSDGDYAGWRDIEGRVAATGNE